MSEMMAIRDAFGAALKDLGTANDKVVALEADVGGSTKSILFGNEFPERYFNVGISELNMVNMSVGLALEGFLPFVNTFAVFLTTRALDPIQSLIAYDRLNVRLCGTYCGLSDSYDGASHQAITDIAIMRSIPNMTVVCASDPIQTKKLVFKLAEYDGPVYFRLSRAPAPIVYSEDSNFEIGKGSVLRTGDDLTIISTGTMLHSVLKAAELLASEGIRATIVDMHTVQPIDRDLIVSCAKRTKAVLTVEEHSIYGGLGGAVAEVLSKECPTPIAMIGATDFAESGNLDQLLEKYGYGAENIAMNAKKLIKKG